MNLYQSLTNVFATSLNPEVAASTRDDTAWSLDRPVDSRAHQPPQETMARQKSAARRPAPKTGNWLDAYDKTTVFFSTVVEEGSTAVANSAEALLKAPPREIHDAPNTSLNDSTAASTWSHNHATRETSGSSSAMPTLAKLLPVDAC
ncbi:hypothetical protein T484DRAFT_1751462 [Baffinella frigidus]|nr:hypothetical protein T484DRAFT_1751462 [Cryptophyta sp. CCMP2293]